MALGLQAGTRAGEERLKAPLQRCWIGEALHHLSMRLSKLSRIDGSRFQGAWLEVQI